MILCCFVGVINDDNDFLSATGKFRSYLVVSRPTGITRYNRFLGGMADILAEAKLRQELEGTLHSKLTVGFLAGLKVYIIVTYLSQIARL